MGPGAIDEVGPDGFADGMLPVGDVGVRDGFGGVNTCAGEFLIG
jgi:hypothetical protein